MSMTVYQSRRDLPAGCFLTECAVSGGTLRAFLRDALRDADGRLCVHIRPVYMDFSLPCPSGTGQPLTARQLQDLHTGQPCHFSEPLCTEYFTYLQEQQLHVVLFDSPDSLRRKFHTAEACGVPMALIEDPALRNLLTQKAPHDCGVPICVSARDQ